jgi:hypothetical protein
MRFLPFKHWDRGLEYHLKHGSASETFCVLSCRVCRPAELRPRSPTKCLTGSKMSSKLQLPCGFQFPWCALAVWYTLRIEYFWKICDVEENWWMYYCEDVSHGSVEVTDSCPTSWSRITTLLCIIQHWTIGSFAVLNQISLVQIFWNEITLLHSPKSLINIIKFVVLFVTTISFKLNFVWLLRTQNYYLLNSE